MKLNELKNGAVVELRNGQRFFKVDNTLLEVEHFVETRPPLFMDLTSFTEDLNHDSCEHKWDIIKVNNNVFNKFGCLNNALCEVGMSKEWTWERPKSILDDEEKETLQFFCNRYKVVYITKKPNSVSRNRRQFITIGVKGTSITGNSEYVETITLPYFEADTMFKGMQQHRKYTPSELGLEVK